jgi:hypothetical protein
MELQSAPVDAPGPNGVAACALALPLVWAKRSLSLAAEGDLAALTYYGEFALRRNIALAGWVAYSADSAFAR